MTDKYYGYTPVSLPYEVAQYDDYASGQSMIDYTPTDWGAADLGQIWTFIKEESDEKATAVADMWRRVATLLEGTGDQLRRFTDALAQKWDSDAGKEFLNQVGRSLYSLDEWKDVAGTNARGLDMVATNIKKNQELAKPIWDEYTRAINHPGSVAGSSIDQDAHGWWIFSSAESEDERKERLRKTYAGKMTPHVQDLANTYMDAAFYHLSRGGRYKGPTNAEIKDPPKYTVPGPGSIPLPSVPNPAVPPVPQPKLPQPGTGLPDVHDQLTLAGGQVAPTLPHPQLPNMPIPGVNLPGTPSLPGMPGVLPPGSLPGGGLTGEELPPGARGGLPGESGLGRSLPQRPNLSGNRRPGAPRPPGSGRGAPNLRGARGRPGTGTPGENANLAEEFEHPSARGPVPPRLNGRRPAGRGNGTGPEEERTSRGGAPRGRGAGEPGDGLSGRRRPGVSEEEQEAFRRGTTGRPDLEGRSGGRRPAAASEPEEAGRGRALRGRLGAGEPDESGAHPGSPGRRGRKRDEQAPASTAPDDGELWQVEQANPAVLDTPAPPAQPPNQPGPALGRPT